MESGSALKIRSNSGACEYPFVNYIVYRKMGSGGLSEIGSDFLTSFQHTVRLNLDAPRMFTVYTCITNQHDLRLVGLAAVICALASFTAISLLRHVRRSNGSMRLVWLAVSATSTGFGIWATHFIAMLAFAPGIHVAYNIPLTLLSLLAAIVLTGAGLAVAMSSASTASPGLGGPLF